MWMFGRFFVAEKCKGPSASSVARALLIFEWIAVYIPVA